MSMYRKHAARPYFDAGQDRTVKTQGEYDYESSVKARPNYDDGAPRKTWEQLGEVEQWSWNRGPKVTA